MENLKKTAHFSISTVEIESGLTCETLRIWELRYNFPNPKRNIKGDRNYSAHQVQQLKIIKMLLDNGARPQNVVGLSLAQLKKKLLQSNHSSPFELTPEQSELITMIKNHARSDLRMYFEKKLKQHSVRSFILDFVSPTINLVGSAWAQGILSIDEEHFFSELLQQRLYQLADHLEPESPKKSILLTTPPGEVHALGIQMVRILSLLSGYRVHFLGPQIPVSDVIRAVQTTGSEIVGIGISSSFSAAKARQYIKSLRSSLPNNVTIWVGGKAVERLNCKQLQVHGFTEIETLDSELASK